jgi:putative heme-binding domain-containing protein
VRFVTRAALVKLAGWTAVEPFLKAPDSETQAQAWLTFTDVADARAVEILAKIASDSDPTIRAKAADALGRAAYLPKEWDGHWWGTQPVKSSLPPNSVTWSGTTKALAALIPLLSDTDKSVRLAAAKGLAYGVGPEALSSLRAQLTAESEPVVRRQLMETIGIQKDPEALVLFTKIALDEKADAEFRDTAIMAAASIGGAEAKKMIAALAEATLSPAATLRVVQSAGEMKLQEAAPALKRYAQSADKPLKMAALKALAALGPKADAIDIFAAALQDKDGETVNAALEEIANLRDARALPALLEFAKKTRPQIHLVRALASIPDPATIPFLVSALRSSSRIRLMALGALTKMREQSWPLIEEAIGSGKIPAEHTSEIRYAFDSGIITKWKVLGPFENVWGAVHPPEDQTLKAGGKVDLSAKYHNAEGNNVGWREVSGTQQDGTVNLGKFFKTEGMVCAYAYTEIESPTDADAKLHCGSDDQIALWLNGAKVHDFGASREMNPESDEVLLHLKAGTNRLFAKVGNLSATWQFAARVPGLDGTKFTPSKEPAPDIKQRAYALAARPDGSYQHAGNAARGEKIFHDPTGPMGAICATCHAVGGKGGQIGPDLSAVAINYKRADLITSIHEPGKTIALGFEQFLITTNSGEIFAGAIRQETNDTLTVLGVDAQPHVVTKDAIKSRTPVPASIMPAGLTLGLKPQEFADLLAYLETLKGK